MSDHSQDGFDVDSRRWSGRGPKRPGSDALPYRRLIESTPETIFALDPNGNFTELNPAGEMLSGRPREALLQRSFVEIVDPDGRTEANRVFAALLAGEQEYARLDLPVTRPSGERRLVQVTVVAVRDGERVVSVQGTARDVTDERLARDELHATNARLAHLLATSPTILYQLTVRRDGQTVSRLVTDNIERILGYRRGEALRPGWWFGGLHADDRDGAISYFDRLQVGGRLVHEYRFRHADGTYRWIRDELRVAGHGADGSLDVTGSWTDITPERRSQRALQESERSYRTLFDSLPEQVGILGANGRILGANQAMLSAYGYARDELIGRDAAILGDPDPANLVAFRNAFGAALTGTRQRLQLWARRRNGDRFPSALSLARGRYFGEDAVILIGQDITRRQQAEAALAAAEAHYRRLVETSPSAIFVTEAQGVVREINSVGAAILARSTGEIVGRSFEEFLPPEDRGSGAEPLRHVLAGRLDRAEYEARIIRPSGELRHVHVHVVAIREGTEVRGAHGVARDITDELKKEQHVRRLERLATVGTLIAGVAHELNNPLQAINSFATLLLENARSPEERRDLETIRREAARASRVVSDLRLLARDSQEVIGGRAQVDLNDVVTHVLNTRRYSLATRNIEARIDLATHLPALWADRGALEQVLLNLVVNAEQALEAADSQRLLIVRTRATGTGVALHVVDSGPGIPRAHLNQIFDPFFTTKARTEGTGLGLALVHKIVAEHGGQIQVESEVGRGAAFHIHLPRLATASATGSAAVAPPVPARPLRVLVVEDEPALRSVLSRYLRRRGHTVDTAADGREALRLVAAGNAPYDVILSDLRMPGMGGDELLAALQRSGEGLESRVLFLTGEAQDSGMAGVLELAHVPIIYKPIELPELAAAVERHAEQLRSPNE